MNKLLSLLLSLVLIAHGGANHVDDDKFSILEEFENLRIEEDDGVEHFEAWTSERGVKVIVNVDSFGAAGDGISDDTQVHILIIFIFLFMLKWMNYYSALVEKM